MSALSILSTPRQAWHFVAIFAWLFAAAVSLPEAQAIPPRHHFKASYADKKILVLHSNEQFMPAYTRLEAGFISQLTAKGFGSRNIFYEFMDIQRNPGEQYLRHLADHYLVKYSSAGIDAIVTVHPEALSFLLNEGQSLFQEVPIVAVHGSEQFSVTPNRRPVVVISYKLDIAGTLKYALTLLPDTKQVLIVGGVSISDQPRRKQAEEQLEPWKASLKIRFLNELPMPEIIQTLSAPPPDTVVIYIGLYQDAAGTRYVPRDALATFSSFSAIPVFGIYDTYLGYGSIGGAVLDYEAEGRRAAETALKIVEGRLKLEPLTIMTSPSTPMFDWQALQRWGLDENKLPKNTIFVNKTFSFWEEFKYWIVGVIVFCAIELLLIAGLLLERKKRNLAQREKESLQGQLLQAQKMESIGRLAGGVAHDFNNMLAVIIGRVEMALRHLSADSVIHKTLEEALKAALRSADLTQRLLAFARKQTINIKVTDLNKAVEAVLSMLNRLIAENIKLDWKPRENLWLVKVDSSQIGQVLANLVVNARDAIQESGSIIIETANRSFAEDSSENGRQVLAGDYVMLSVSDTGRGMNKEVLEHLFEPFFTTKEVGKGTGLGLATVYGIVKQNSGFVDVRSKLNEGTSVEIYLPRVLEQEPEEEAPPEVNDVSGSETILVVEDEDSVRTLVRDVLTASNYKILTAATAAEAVNLAKNYTGSIDLLISDVIMPGMNGRELKEKLLLFRPAMKVLFISGYTADVIADHRMLAESEQLMQKPFSIKDLRKKVREILET